MGFLIHIGLYLRTILGGWVSLLSGIAGVVLLVLTVFLSDRYAVLRDNKTTFVWAAIVCVLVAGFAAWRKERVQLEKLAGQSNRVTLSATPDELVSVFDGRTTAQGERLAAAYVEKWLQVGGLVGDVVSDVFGERIDLDTPAGDAGVILYFQKKWRDTLSALRKGDSVIVLGQIKYVHTNHIALRSCDLIDTRVTEEQPAREARQLSDRTDGE